MKRRVLMDYGAATTLAHDLDVPRQTVYRALGFKPRAVRVDLAERIRKVAIERGAVLVEIPEANN